MVEPATSTSKATYGLVDEALFPTSNLIAPGSFRAASVTTDTNTSNTFPATMTIKVTLDHTLETGSDFYAQLPAGFGVATLQTNCISAVGFTENSPDCTVSNLASGATLIMIPGTKSLMPG